MYAQTHVVEVTTGTATGVGYTPVVTGRILQIRYVKPASGGFDDGVDFDVTLEDSGVAVWSEDNVNASKTVCPRQAAHGVDGVAAEYATGFPVEEPVVVADERIKVAVAAGGNGTTGTFHITVG